MKFYDLFDILNQLKVISHLNSLIAYYTILHINIQFVINSLNKANFIVITYYFGCIFFF